jgi:replicative DNA helicase
MPGQDNVTSSRLPPQNLDAERALLGGVMLDNEIFDKITGVVDESDFYRESHRRIFEAMAQLHKKAEPIDLVTLGDQLRSTGGLESVGGSAYLSQLLSVVPTASASEHYAKLIREKAILRKLIAASDEIARESYETSEDIEKFLDGAEKKIFEIAQTKVRTPYVSVKEVAREAFKRLEMLSTSDEDLTGTTTGYRKLDDRTSGLQPGHLVIIAARPGMGKTSLALNIAQNVAIMAGKPVIIFSLEMSREDLTMRMLSSQSSISAEKFRFPKRMQDADWGPLSAAIDKLNNAPIFLDDTAGISVMEIRGKARRLRREMKRDLGLVVIDYLQLMRGGSRYDNREQEISDISRSLKALSKELKAPVIALSQLNREAEKRPDKRPTMAELRESGSIEQDADMVMLLYETIDKEYQDLKIQKATTPEGDNTESRTVDVTVNIVKQRSGPTGPIIFRFFKSITKFGLPEEGDYSIPGEPL